MYPKIIRFLWGKIKEPVMRQHLESSAKKAILQTAVVHLSFSKFCLKNTTCQRIFTANDVALFPDAVSRKQYLLHERKWSVFLLVILMNFELFSARFHLTGICIVHKVRNFNQNNERDYDGLWKWYYKNKICVSKEPRWWAARKAVFRNTIKMMHLSQCMSTVDATGYYIKLLIGFQVLRYKYSSWSDI